MPNAEVIRQQIAQIATDEGAADLIPLLYAIAKQESNFDPGAVGDGGNSVGLYQENINGRGHGLSRAARSDVAASTRRAISEIRVTQRKNPDADAGTIAILAQRPAESVRTGYRANINADVKRAQGAPITEAQTSLTPAPARRVAGQGALSGHQPSAIAQAAAARAVEIAGSQGRPTGQQTAGSLQGAAASAAGSKRAANIAFNGTYVMPVDGTVTNPWGGKQVYSAGKSGDIGGFNNGTDIAAPAGTVVRAPVGGTVVAVYNSKFDDRKGERNADENSGWGGSIEIKGDDGKTHHLSHAQYGSIQVKPGDRVEAGEPTHLVGMTGNATGPHVDYERWANGVGKGQSEDALKSPMVSSAKGAEVYRQALQRSNAQSAQTTQRTAAAVASGDAAPAEAPAATGDTPVADDPSASALSTLDAREKELRARIDLNSRAMQAYQMVLAIPDNGPQPGMSQQQYNAFQQEQSNAKKQLEALAKEVQGDQSDLQSTITSKASVQNQASGKTLTPEEADNLRARTAQTRAETAALKDKLANGGLTDLEAQNVRSQIAAREAELAVADRRVDLEAARNPSAIRATNAQAGAAEWGVAESQAMLPFSIDRVIAQTDLDAVQAQRLKEMLAPELEKAWTDIWRLQQITPVEIAEGRANADLTRQRADEIRKTVGPNVKAILARAGVDTANAAKIEQMLPLEMADLRSTTQLRAAQTGKTNQETRLTQLQADAEVEKQKRWSAIEEQIRANPNMSVDQVNKLVMGAATNIQDWATAYRTQLESQVARNQQLQKTQELQINQQSTDSNVKNQRETEALGAENARTNQVNSLTSSLGEAQGPMRRTAQLAAAAPLVGVSGLTGLAAANRWGTQELNPVQAAFQQFQGRLDSLRNSAGAVRTAPTVTAPPGIDIGFTMPTAAPRAGVGDTSGVAGGVPPPASSTQAINAVNAQSTTQALDPNFTMPGSPLSEEQKRLGIRRIGGV